MLSINWMVTLFIVVPLSLSIFGVQKLSERMKEKRKANREAHDDVSALIADVTGSVLSIKTADAEVAVLDRAREANSLRRKSIMADALFGAKTDTLLKSAVSVGTVIMMAVAASLIPSGKLMIGDFSLFVLHLGTLADCVNRIVELIYESKKAEVSYERILETIGEDNNERLYDDVGLTLKPGGCFISKEAMRIPLYCFDTQGLSFAYAEGGGFRNVTLSIHPGELIVVTGKIGSGKTTLLGALSGIVKANSGRLLWNGEDIQKTPALQRPPMIAYAPQRGGFFSTDIRTNVCLGYPTTDEELAKALHLAVFDETIATMEHGLDTHIGNRGEALSGGQRQRLTLARMFLRNAEISLIDDNISGLDEPTLLRLHDNISRYVTETNHAVIIATNHEAFLRTATRVLIMEDGRIVTDGI
jgi:ATP-binding cassette subfamily B protein